jgi:aconitate hydratase
MGVLPLEYKDGETAASLGLTGEETFSIEIDDTVKPHQLLKVTAEAPAGTKIVFDAVCRLDTIVDVDYFRNGGILHTVLRNMLR